MRVLALLSVGLLSATPAACQVRAPSRDATRADAPTLAELGTATYRGFEIRDTVTLTDGRWEGAPYQDGGAARPRIALAPDFRVAGDLDGDGREEAVVALMETSGGTGVWVYLAMTGRRTGQVVNLATHRLGDRVQIRDARIEHGVLYVDVLRGGRGDAACCPGELASLEWRLRDGEFDLVAVSGTTRRFDAEALGGAEWVLRRWDEDEPTDPDDAPTLRVESSRVSGNAGCNDYGGLVTQIDQPGEMRFGSFGLTRMMCPAMEIEQRFLQSLGAAVKVGFWTGRLAISYLKPDRSLGTMLFERRPLAR